MYKVKWESTWEPEERLQDYGDLLEKFWSIVHTAKDAARSDSPEGTRCGCSRKRTVLHPDSFREVPVGKKSYLNESIVSPTQAGAASDASSHSIFGSSPTLNLPTYRVASADEEYRVKQEPKVENAVSFAFQRPVMKFDFENEATENTFYLDTFENEYFNLVYCCKKCDKEVPKCTEWAKHFASHDGTDAQGRAAKALDESDGPDTEERLAEWLDFCKRVAGKMKRVPRKQMRAVMAFTSDFVNMKFVCKFCKKEIPYHGRRNWKAHYSSHQVTCTP